MQPRYLGDGVYAEYDGFQVWLKVEGFNADNRIAIEPTVFDALCRYYAEIGVVRGVVADQAQVIALEEDRSRALREVDSVMSETNIDGRV